ncbi:MAG: hypothetical protein J0L86_08125 [Flavobacteriales bacterium]|nr:hypothetical protein [Flavobacteriales bacterium]
MTKLLQNPNFLLNLGFTFSMTIQDYLSKINTLYKTGNAREHSYRGDLQNLLMSIEPML